VLSTFLQHNARTVHKHSQSRQTFCFGKVHRKGGCIHGQRAWRFCLELLHWVTGLAQRVRLGRGVWTWSFSSFSWTLVGLDLIVLSSVETRLFLSSDGTWSFGLGCFPRPPFGLGIFSRLFCQAPFGVSIFRVPDLCLSDLAFLETELAQVFGLARC